MTKLQEAVLLQILNTNAVICTALSGLDELSEVRDLLRSQARICEEMARVHLEYMRKN